MVTGQRDQIGLFLKDLGIIFPAKVVKIFGHFFTILKNVNILAKTVGVTFGKIGLLLITTSGHTDTLIILRTQSECSQHS